MLPTGIPRKGEVVSRLAAWWFDRVKEVIPNHFIALIESDNASLLPFPLSPEYYGRSMLVRKAQRLDAECIARGYLTGTGWDNYQRTGIAGRIPLPEGMLESQKLPQTMFTASSGVDGGHDDMSADQLAETVGAEAANAMGRRTIALYDYAHTVALERGIIIAESKFGFGIWNDEVILIDEILTPDSSRFWQADTYRPGAGQPSFDNQPVLDWIAASDWKASDPAPAVPADVVAATNERYERIYEMLTGENLP